MLKAKNMICICNENLKSGDWTPVSATSYGHTCQKKRLGLSVWDIVGSNRRNSTWYRVAGQQAHPILPN